MTRTTWTKHLTVDKSIVRLLSASTYEDFPGAIREMVSNAYDADATQVNITVDLEEDVIEIKDDGIGITPEEFDFFLRIAGKRVGKRISPELGRRIIGQFGIGFLAVFPFGKRIKVTSSAFRSDIQFEATIPTEEFIRYDHMVIDLEKIPISGFQIQDPQNLSKHGTEIRILGLTKLVKAYFQERDFPIQKARQTIMAWPPMERLEWSLKEDLPLEYPDGTSLREAFDDLGPSGMKVFLNGIELLRNAPGLHILENDTWEYNGIKCRYAIATDWKSIAPSEERFIKQRLMNVGIGKRTTFGLGLTGRAYSRLHWLTGEVRILEGLDNLLSIDRTRFVDSPESDEFSEFFRGKLAYHANYVETIAEAKRDIRRQLTDSRNAEVGSRKEIINRKIEKLESKGFRVVKKSIEKPQNTVEPVYVDVEKRTVKVIESHPAFSDTINFDNQLIPIRYTRSDESEEELLAIKRSDDGVVTINASYPLFKSRRYGEVFKKVFIVLLLLAERTDSIEELVKEFSKKLLMEFREIK